MTLDKMKVYECRWALCCPEDSSTFVCADSFTQAEVIFRDNFPGRSLNSITEEITEVVTPAGVIAETKLSH